MPSRRGAATAVGRRLTQQPLRNLGALGAGVVLLATAAFGGLEPAEEPGATGFGLGDTVHAAPLEVTVDRVVWVDGGLPGATLTDDANRWIAVVAAVSTDHSASLSAEPARTVALAGVDGLVGRPVDGSDAVLSDEQLVLADGSRLSPMQPGLTYEVAFLFEQAAGAPAPTEVDLVLLGHTWRADSFDGTEQWLDPSPVARARVPARPAEDSSGAEAGDAAGTPTEDA